MSTDDPLQRYQIMEPLGPGGQGNTFRAIDRDTNRSVAVKVLSLRSMKDWKFFDLFEREAKVLQGLDHPGIPKYIDRYGSEASGDYFLVMELVEGRPLRDFLSGDRRLSTEQLRQVFDGLLDILEYLHTLVPPVIHRDIKPANVILRPDGGVSLVDFGGVRRALAAETGSTTVGTFGYMAPEQLYGAASPASDLYALAATVAALLGGVEAEQLPHQGLRIDITTLGVPPDLVPALQGMLEPEPEARLASVQAVRAALASAGSSSGRPQPGSRATGRSAGPKPGSQAEEKALAKIPEAARSLAKTPAPFSVLVWIVAALASGFLLVVEAVFFPIAYQILSSFYDKKDRPRREGFERDMEDFKTRVRIARDAASYVAGETRPSTDES